MSAQVNKCITETNENTMLPSHSINVVSDTLNVSVFIHDGPVNVFYKRLETVSDIIETSKCLKPSSGVRRSSFNELKTLGVKRVFSPLQLSWEYSIIYIL